jgi:hypothetical protein
MQEKVTYVVILLIILASLIGCHGKGSNVPVDMGDVELVTLAVLYFDTDEEALGNLTLDTLIIEFSKMQEFAVVEREKLDAVLDELGLSATDLVDEATKVRVGKVLGAHLMCSGSITRLPSKTIIVAGYLTRVETTENFGGGSADGKNELKTIKAFAEQMKTEMRQGKALRIIKEISEAIRANK